MLAKAQEGIRETRCHHCVGAALQDLGNLLGTGVAVHTPGPCECGQPKSGIWKFSTVQTRN